VPFFWGASVIESAGYGSALYTYPYASGVYGGRQWFGLTDQRCARTESVRHMIMASRRVHSAAVRFSSALADGIGSDTGQRKAVTRQRPIPSSHAGSSRTTANRARRRSSEDFHGRLAVVVLKGRRRRRPRRVGAYELSRASTCPSRHRPQLRRIRPRRY